MVALELLIDASGMQRGAQQATAALDQVNQKAAATEQVTRRAGAALSAAFQTTGGVNQIASGIAQSAKSFSDLGIAAGAFGASRTILELAKTAQDFGQLRDSIGATGSTMSVLATIMRAHPLLTIATVVSAAASAISLFSSSTKEAANSWDDLAKNMAKAKLDERTAAYLGISTGSAKNQQLQQVFGATANAVGGNGGTVTDIAASSGVSRVDLIRFLANNGNPQAREYLQTGGVSRTGGGQLGVSTIDSNPEFNLSASQVQQILRQRYNELTQETRGPDTSNLYQFGANNALERNKTLLEMQPYAPNGSPGNMVEQDRMARSAQEWEDHAAKVAENMRAAERFSAQIGSNFGASLYDVLAGVNTLRGALASLVGSTARQGLASIGGSIAGSLGRALGQTATQSSADSGINWAGGVGSTPYGPN